MNSNTSLILATFAAALCTALAACGPGVSMSAAGLSIAECRAIADRFDTIHAGADGACRTNADCGCYNPVSRKSGCGGITDRETAKKLGELEAEFHRAKCPWWFQCAPWACMPVCAAGRCVNGR